MNKNKAEVNLISVTSNALELLIYTKSSRLKTGTTLQEIIEYWPMGKKLEHLSYMMNTVKTSFEFVDYVFEIKNVSRAFTHQLVRTRTASYQQQSQRTVDMRNSSFIKTTDHPSYLTSATNSFIAYEEMIDDGVAIQDARGVLPTATYTEIIFKANLRTLSQMAELRLCKRTQGEYQEVFKKIKKEVIFNHPWAAPLLEVHCVKYGVCAFPRYKECPVQKFCFKPEDRRGDIRRAWEVNDHEANPVVNKDGFTM